MEHNELTQLVVKNFKKRWKINDEDVEKQGRSIILKPNIHEEYLPMFKIRNIDEFEKILVEYLKTIQESKIQSTQIDDRHTFKYFLFNIWKNATSYDFQNPDKFINRYTHFMKDTTFSEYQKMQKIGKLGENDVWIQRIEEEYGFETPYIFQIYLSHGEQWHPLPKIRYGISNNRYGGKISYIYAIQGEKNPIKTAYDLKMDKLFKQINHGVKQQRNVSPSAVVTLAIFLGLLDKNHIHCIKCPDFLIGRYGHFTNNSSCRKYTQEEIDYIQSNLTEKFFHTFLRLEQHFNHLKIEDFPNDCYNSFLCMSLTDEKSSNCELLQEAYNIGNVRKQFMLDEDIVK